jgi:predicted secreted protein
MKKLDGADWFIVFLIAWWILFIVVGISQTEEGGEQKMMTTGEMAAFTNRLNEITSSTAPDELKDQRLASLMTDLEHVYQIPGLKNDQFENNNPFVMQLYRTCIS